MGGLTGKGLRVAADLWLPIDYVTKTAAILAQRRKGKTYTGAVIAEELVAVKLPWVALDPTGAWWGLRSSADGQEAGYPVVVLGGQHADLPLERGAGAFVADLVLDHPGWYVLDLSLFESRAAEREFSAEFAKRLYRRKMQPGMDFPLHLFVDEADLFVPQEKEGRGDLEVLGAFQAIVRRGGLHGLGTTLISQRPALVNKSVLTQLDLLILLRLVAGQDQDAVSKNYITRAASKLEAAELMATLASLPVGEAWFFEPGEGLKQRVKVRSRRTFNSSATPKPGEKRVEPKVFAKIDLASLEQQMSESIERVRKDDPRELHARIAQLESDLRAKPKPAGEPVEVEVEKRVEVPVPVLTDADRRRIEQLGGKVNAEMERVAERVARAMAPLAKILERVERDQAQAGRALAAAAAVVHRPKPVVLPEARVDLSDSRVALNGALPTPQQRIIDAIAWYEQLGVSSPTKVQVAMIAGYSAKSGGYANLLGKLRSAEMIDYPAAGTVALSDAGRARAQVAELPSTDEGVQAAVMSRLPNPQQTLLRELIAVWPDALRREELAERAGYSASSGGYANLLGKLRTGSLIDYTAPGEVRAEDVLFPMSRR